MATKKATPHEVPSPMAEGLLGMHPADNDLLKAYFQCNVSVALARKSGDLGVDEVPFKEDMATCFSEYIEGFSSKFAEAPVNEDGEILWPEGNVRGLVGGSYEYWMRVADLALAVDTEEVGKQFGKATELVITEQDTGLPAYFPGTPDFNDPMLEALGPYCADRVDWWLRQAYKILSGSDRTHFRPVYQCRPADLLAVLEATVEMKDSDETVNDAEAIDHHDTYDIGTLSRAEMKARFGTRTTLEVVEFSKWEPLIKAAKAWHRWVQACGADEVLKERLERSIESAREYVDGLRKSRPTIKARKRRSAAPVKPMEKAS